MLRYLAHRLFIMIPTLIAISVIVFVIIQLPPGDYLETYIAELQSRGEAVDEQHIAFLREAYGFDRPMWEQYLHWIFGMLQGDFGSCTTRGASGGPVPDKVYEEFLRYKKCHFGFCV